MHFDDSLCLALCLISVIVQLCESSPIENALILPGNGAKASINNMLQVTLSVLQAVRQTGSVCCVLSFSPYSSEWQSELVLLAWQGLSIPQSIRLVVPLPQYSAHVCSPA